MHKKTGLILMIHFILFNTGFSQSAEETIKKLNGQLQKGETTITGILTNNNLMHLHSLTPFREMIKANAKAEKIKLVSNHEPGTFITVKGTVTDHEGKPVKNCLVYVYHTSDKGWYSDTAAHILIMEGDIRHARLFGYFKTDTSGKFVFETIKPRGYPKSDLAAHIHIHLWTKDLKPLHGPGELQFDDDERMTPERRKKSLEEGSLISQNTGTAENPVYEYKIIADE